MSVERSKAIYNSLHIRIHCFHVVSVERCIFNRYINGTTLFKLHVVTVEMYKIKYNKIPHITMVSCRECRKASFSFELQCIF